MSDQSDHPGRASLRDDLELEKLRVEVNKIIAETGKMVAEIAKINREVTWHPYAVGGGVAVAFITAVAALAGVAVRVWVG